MNPFKVIFLGTGTSQGVPVIGCKCETCLSADSRDKRLRTSCLISFENVNILIDTAPDLRTQMLNNKIEKVDTILFTHEHNDHMAGLDDIRPFNFMHNTSIPAYGESRVVEELETRFSYIFDKSPYPGAPRVTLHKLTPDVPVSIKGIEILPIRIMHGGLPILGYRIGKFAYLTDVKSIPKSSFALLKGIKYLAINALRYHEHYSHLTVNEAIDISKKMEVELTYLTHMSHQIVKHELFQNQLPDGIKPAYDGLIWDIS